MKRDKKGLSTVVTTLIIILLVLVAIGVVWVVLRGIIETGAQEVDVGAKCLPIDVRAVSVDCTTTPGQCDVSLNRKTGGESISGVKLVFTNSTAGRGVNITDFLGNIPELGSATTTVLVTNMGIPGGNGPDSVEVTPYILDSSGNEHICSTVNTLAF